MNAEQQEQKRIFTQMYNEANQRQNAEPAAALQIFEEMQARFPNAEGIAPWITYLRKRLQRAETTQQPHPSTSSNASTPASHTQADTTHTVDHNTTPSSPAPTTPQTPTAKVEIDQDQIKQWVRQAGDAAKDGDRDAAAAWFDRALTMLRDGSGPEKTRIKLMEKRLSLKADRAMCIEGAKLSQETGDLDMAGRFLEIAIRQQPHDIECLRMDVEIAQQISNPHRLLSALLKLSDAYEKTGDLVSYDRMQRELRAVRDRMREEM